MHKKRASIWCSEEPTQPGSQDELGQHNLNKAEASIDPKGQNMLNREALHPSHTIFVQICMKVAIVATSANVSDQILWQGAIS